MKILIVIPYFMPAISYGGPVTVSYDIAKGLVARGHEVTVATTDVFDDRSRLQKTTEVIDGINVLRFRNVSNTLAKRMNGYLPWRFVPWFVKKSRQFDIVYCHDFFSLQATAAGLICKYNKIPFLLQPHGSLSDVRKRARFFVIKKFLTFIFGGILRNARNIIALTEKEKREIVSLVPTMAAKVVVIPNGLDPEQFSSIEKVDLWAKYHIPRGNKIIGFIGRLSYIKGVDIALEILASLRDRYAFSFLIMGPDEGELARLKQQATKLGIRERVLFTGILTGQEKLRIMKSCDLFLLTSRDEGLPMSVLEAAALGIPQVVSLECHVPELAEYHGGYMHSYRDSAGIAESIESILSNKTDWQSMGQNAQLMVKDRFTKDFMLDRIEELLVRNVTG